MIVADVARVLNYDADLVEVLPAEHWRGPFPADWRDRALAALEAGRIVVFPHLRFLVEAGEMVLLDQSLAGRARKNIGFDPASRQLSNAASDQAGAAALAGMIERFSDQALGLLHDLLPSYAAHLDRGRASFRPNEIVGRAYSPRHDDKRLHVDAFPSRPVRGRRILRVFANIAADGAVRRWQVGEPFPSFAQKFMPRLKPPIPGSLWLLKLLKVTKDRRSLYDHYMLGLHDRGKLDDDYQAQAPRTDLYFKPGTTWLCFTDQVLHAALAGHSALEQTFYLPVEAMANPAASPLRVLENIAQRALA